MNTSLTRENLKKATLYKLALRTIGVNVVDNIPGVGVTIKENINGLYKINQEQEVTAIPNEISITNNITTKLVVNNRSIFSLRKDGKDFYVFSQFMQDPLFKANFSRRPLHYSLTTSSGTPMKSIGQVMGNDCLAIAIDKQCVNFKNGTPCKYCNINPTNHESGLPRFSSLDDIAELIDVAGKRYRFIDLTGGTFEDRDEECKTYTQVGGIIRNALGRKFSGPFSLSPPITLDLLVGLYETGVDVVSFNMDVWDNQALAYICPGKYKIGKKHYEAALLRAKDLWGQSNSVIQFLAGPWESNQSLLEGTKYFLDKGILVNITTFHPSPGSTMKNAKPKSFLELVNLYIEYGELVRGSKLYPNARNSILTSESGNRSSISNEVSKGYLTRENFNADNDLKFLGGKNE